MSEKFASPPAPARIFAALADGVAESLLAGAFLFAMDALAHLKLTAGGFGLVAGGWVVALCAARLIRRATFARDWMLVAIELVLPALWLGAVNSQLKQPWSVAQIVYAALLVGALWRGWRWLLSRGERAGLNRHAETLRLFLVGLTAGGAVLPFFTDLQLGGSDARWYTGVFFDFVHQLRAGIFPVFVGQGEYAFNGSVNLFRTAPLCLWLGGLADWLTGQSLSPVAIRNLAVITAALGAGFGMYAVLCKLARMIDGGEPTSAWTRWAAALAAALYVLCPGVLLTLYYYELQMTFTALLALPWILYGNIRTLHGTDGRGYVPLVAGLALVWLAHAPLAIISMLCTVAWQVGRFIFEPAALAQWKQAAGGALLFGLLSAYYFLGMSELPSTVGPYLRQEGLFLVGIGLVVFGVVRLFHHRRWSGLPVWLAGAALVYWTMPGWLAWVAGWGVIFGTIVMVLRRTRVTLDGATGVLLATVTMSAAAAGAELWARSKGIVHEESVLREVVRNASARVDLFRLLTRTLTSHGSSQPGYALWLLAGVAILGAVWLRNLTLALLTAILVLFVSLILSLPLASDFIVGLMPLQIGTMVNLPMFYRLLPPLAALIVVAGFITLIRLSLRQPGWRIGSAGLLAVGFGWSAWEARQMLYYGASHVATRGATAHVFSADNFSLGRYPYLMLQIPPYFMDGKQTYWLESRLLNTRGDLVTGPKQLAERAEEFNSDTHPLTSKEDESYSVWLRLTPAIEVQPGESLLLRFEFDTEMNCSGWLLLMSERGYQEHYLNPAYEGQGFGAGRYASPVLAVINSSSHIERYRMQLKVDTGNTLPRDGRPWGKLHISRYDAAKAPVKVESLIPFRAVVTAGEDGFLETPRQWLAGYRAWVDGSQVEPVQLKSGLVGIPLKAGRHVVDLSFIGSARLWLGLGISTATLLGLLVWPVVKDPGWWRKTKGEFLQWTKASQT